MSMTRRDFNLVAQTLLGLKPQASSEKDAAYRAAVAAALAAKFNELYPRFDSHRFIHAAEGVPGHEEYRPRRRRRPYVIAGALDPVHRP